MLNALSSRPDDRSAELALAEAVAMRLPEGAAVNDAASFRRETGLRPIGTDLGTFFLADITRNTHGSWWRVPSSHCVDRRSLLLFYCSRNATVLEVSLGATSDVFMRRAANPHRTSNRQPITLAVEQANPDAIADLGGNLSERGLLSILNNGECID